MVSLPQEGPPRMHELERLGHRATKGFHNRQKKLALLGKTTHSRLASSLYLESSIHLAAAMGTFADLHKELALWSVTPKPTKHLEGADKAIEEIGQKIEETGWNLAVHALERCVQVAEVSETEELLKVAWVIADKTASLFGGEYVKSVVELINALREGGEIWKIQDSKTREGVKFVAELELFMAGSLAANLYAVAQVHGLTRPRPDLNSDVSLEEGGKVVMNEAKSFVVEEVRQLAHVSGAHETFKANE